jgi:hypothetical protein
MLDNATLNTLAIRPPNIVMDLERLGALSASRLSFTRCLLRQMARQRWQITTQHLDLDQYGHGSAIYRLQTPSGRYHIVIFSRELMEEKRSDRVTADAWDLTFGLVEGDVEDALMASLAENLPLQEAGRQHPQLLVISRANKSKRNFENFVEHLASGNQPDTRDLKKTGYLYRTTAVYGNGKFGIKDYFHLRDNLEFRQPFAAQMIALYVLRQFSIDQLEHIAGRRAPDTAVRLNSDIKRFIGVGNSTGLGMAPFLINHPLLINHWIHCREQALAIAKATPVDDALKERFVSLCQRALVYYNELEIEDFDQTERNNLVVSELETVVSWCQQMASEAGLWYQVTDWAEAALSLETQELLNSLLIELCPESVEQLEDEQLVEETMELIPDMPLIQLKQIIETQFDWALSQDLAQPDQRYWFWYRSVEKEEPRLGVRGVDPGVEKELSLAIGPRVQEVYKLVSAYLEDNAMAVTIEFLMGHSDIVDVVRRIQAMSSAAYGEIRGNLWHRTMKPMHLLRTKLAFLGASRFDPLGDRWVRVTFFQGAPNIAELNAEPWDLHEFDDWSFASAPVAEVGAS